MSETKATRAAYGEALAKLGHENDKIVVLDADLSHATMTLTFANTGDSLIYISVKTTDGAGGGLTNVVSSGSGNAVTDLSYNKGTKVLTWTKGSIFALRSEIPTVPTAIKNPYSLSWSGYSSGSYDGSSAKSISIPNNTNQLTNGAGFIKDGNGNFTTLSGSGSSSKYLAGNGTFYTISYSEISGTPNLSVYMPIAGGTFTGVVNMNNGTTFPYYRVTNSVGWAQLAGTSGTYLGSTVSGIIQSSLGFAIMGRNSSPNMVVFDGGTMKASADVVAYASSSSISDIVAIATSTSYGVVKYDGDTLRVNSSGQLYVASGGSGGSSVSWGTNSTYSIPLTVDGVTYTLEKLGYTYIKQALKYGGLPRCIYLKKRR